MYQNIMLPQVSRIRLSRFLGLYHISNRNHLNYRNDLDIMYRFPLEFHFFSERIELIKLESSSRVRI